MDLNNWINILQCPLCSGDLVSNESTLTCHSCRKTFPVHFGIPDFRLFPPDHVGYRSEEKDLELSAYLFDRLETSTFEELVHIYVKRGSGHLDQVLRSRYIRYRLDNHVRAKKLVMQIQNQDFFRFPDTGESFGLDIGCGSGCGISALLELGLSAIGADISISELIIAKSFLKNYYPENNYFLIAGVAEHMPFRNEFFSHVLAVDVIEHVLDQKQFIRDVYRVLHPDGCFYFDTCSRFVWDEPHTALPAVGYLPRFLQPLYVRMARQRNYKIHLPSQWELKKWLNESPFDNWKIIYNQIDKASRPRTWRGKVIRTIPGLLHLRNLLLKHTSSFEIFMKKSS